MPEAGRTIWFATDTPSNLVEAIWVDGSVIYDLTDGRLTAINLASTEVLRCLRELGEASLDELQCKLFGELVSEQESQQLMQILEQLSALSLVRNRFVQVS